MMTIEKIHKLMTPVKVINFILISFCLFGFVYQVYLIFTQYMLGKTVVNIEVKRFTAQPLPAITVCIPPRYDISKISKLSEKNKGLYQDYMKMVNIGKSNRTFPKELKQGLKKIYKNMISDFGIKLNFDQIFELSITPFSIRVTLEGQNKSLINESLIRHMITNNRSPFSFLTFDIPVKSFAIKEGGEYRQGLICFTYFSALQEYWNSFRMDIKSITIQIIIFFDDYPPVDEYLVAIHSSNIIQEISGSNYIPVKPNELYSVKYSQMITEFHPNGFESNCHEYNITNEYGTIRMPSDCRIKCIADIVQSRYSFFTWDLVRREHKQHFSNFLIPISTRYIFSDELFELCSKRCKPDCNTKLFLTELIKTNDYDSFGIKVTSDVTNVNFKHSSIPDIIIRHSFEMTLMSFVCNFGGLLGMWLGLSVLSISKDVFTFIRHLIRSDKNKINLYKIKNFNLNVAIKSNESYQQNNLSVVEIY